MAGTRIARQPAGLREQGICIAFLKVEMVHDLTANDSFLSFCECAARLGDFEHQDGRRLARIIDDTEPSFSALILESHFARHIGDCLDDFAAVSGHFLQGFQSPVPDCEEAEKSDEREDNVHAGAPLALSYRNLIQPSVEVMSFYCHHLFMTLDEYNDFCGALMATSRVVQWGGSHVWKVGGKIFAVAGWGNEDVFAVTFKVTPLSFDILQEQPGLRPAPYLASRGMKWIQHYAEPGLKDGDLKAYIETSHRLVADGLSKKKQKELGLLVS